jgi:hypoxanthine-DNA glycosylase
MDYSYFNSFEIESNPFGTFIPANPRILIVGTFPTHKSNRYFEWYYSCEGNRFWEVMGAVLHHKFEHNKKNPAVIERKALMEKHGIAMTDIVEQCYRRNMLSQDHHLFPINLIDIVGLLNQHQSIETVVFTSRTSVVGALGMFETLLHQKKMKFPEMVNHDGILEGWLPLAHNEISLLVPYSPSKTLAEKEFASTRKLIQMYDSCPMRKE